MKKFVAVMTSLVICLTLAVSVSAFENFEYTLPADEEVKFIVEMEKEPVINSIPNIAFGTEYVFDSDVRNNEAALKKAQMSVMNTVEKSFDAEIRYSYTLLFNGFSVKAQRSAAAEIEALPGVKKVYEVNDMEVYLGSSVAQADALPSQTADSYNTSGYTGAGQVIAIIDSEFDVDNEMFKVTPKNPTLTKADIDAILPSIVSNKNYGVAPGADVYYSEKIPFMYDYVNRRKDTNATGGFHGTHVAAIAGGGAGRYSEDIQFSEVTPTANFSGVAPDAQLILMKAGTGDGGINIDAAFKAMEDAVKLGVCAINMSFGMACESPDTNTLYNEFVGTARKAGVMLLAAAGNDGMGYRGMLPQSDGQASVERIDYSTSGTPASYSDIMSVASGVNDTLLYSNNVIGVNNNAMTVSQYSSYGVNSSLELKPEISAPGQQIISAWSKYDNCNNDNIQGNNMQFFETTSADGTVSRYALCNGTSMATPHVTGIVALMNEYFDARESTLSGEDRVKRIENMLMSTADIMFRKNTDIPYSPRVQGAGMVNVKAAMDTKAIAYGNDGKSKLSLGDNLTDEISLSFNIENLGSSTLAYDTAEVYVVTDEVYKNKNDGKNYVLPGKSVRLNASVSSADSPSIGAGNKNSANVRIQLDSAQLARTREFFTNGFFIDGYVIMSDADVPESRVSLPFTGFYGSWDDSPTLDTPMYSQYGSELYWESGSEVDGKMVYDTNMATFFITNTYYNGKQIYMIHGMNRDGIFKEGYAAFSPNDDGFGDFVGVNTAFWREAKAIKMGIKDIKTNEIIYLPGLEELSPKFTKYGGGWEFGGYEEGEYRFVIKATLNYDGAAEETLEMPFYIDLTAPIINGSRVEDNILTVDVYDNHYTDYVYLVDEEYNILQEEYINGERDTTNSVSFDLTGLDVNTLGIALGDVAQNSNILPVTDYVGNVWAQMVNCVSGETTFNLENVSSGDISGKLVAAYYKGDGKLLTACTKDITLGAGMDNNYTFYPQNAGEGTKVKLFIWNGLQGIEPLDIGKKFTLTW